MGLAKIEQLISQLDSTWYEKKKYWFEKEPLYNHKHGIIYDVFEGSYWQDEAEGPVKEPDTVIDIDFKKYCWNSYYPGCLDSNEGSNEVYPTDLKRVVSGILIEINQMISQVITDDVKYNIIMQSRETMIEKVEYMLTLQPDNIEYIETLKDFLQRARIDLHNEHKQFKEAYEAAKKYQDKLVFDLKQEELAALLYILYKADFFHQSTTGDTVFLDFCRKFFYFQNQKKPGVPTIAKGIVKKFSDARGKDYPSKPRTEMVERLKEAFKHL